MATSQLLDIFLIAMVAGIVLFRLYSVLGRRTGHERPPQGNLRLTGNAQTDAAAAIADGKAVPPAVPTARPTDPVAAGLVDIALADRGFDKDHFVSGARSAYEMIVTGFAAGDRALLRSLLNDEVYAAFDAEIRGREERGEKIAFTFVGFKDVKIVGAVLKGRTAEISLTFAAQFISARTGAAGNVIEGDSKSVRDVTDVWTFARDLRGRDPNWTLVGTTSDECV